MPLWMLFYSLFKTLVGKNLIVELKTGSIVSGTLASVDQFLNFKLENIKAKELPLLENCFIRSSVVYTIQIDPCHIDIPLLQEATRREFA